MFLSYNIQHGTTFMLLVLDADNTGNKDKHNKMPPAHQPRPTPPAPINQEPPGPAINVHTARVSNSPLVMGCTVSLLHSPSLAPLPTTKLMARDFWPLTSLLSILQ